MLKKSLIIIVATISLFLVSCASVSYTVLQDYTPKNNPSDKIIDVYYTKKPEKPYKEVVQMSTYGDEGECIREFKNKALGLDAIIMNGNFTKSVPYSTTNYSSNFNYNTSTWTNSQNITNHSNIRNGSKAVGIIYE